VYQYILGSCSFQYYFVLTQVQIQVILQLTVCLSVSPSIRPPTGTRNQFFFLSMEIVFRHLCFFSIERPLWQEDRSIIYSYKCYWALPALSLRVLVQQYLKRYLNSLIFDWVTFRHLLRLAGLQWKYSNPLPDGGCFNCCSTCTFEEYALYNPFSNPLDCCQVKEETKKLAILCFHLT
jgi:hypothetical protein